MNNPLNIKYLSIANSKLSLPDLGELLTKTTDEEQITCCNWSDFQYQPDVRFNIGYHEQGILLGFHVVEQSVVALETQVNGAVYKDSCVEFFISFDTQNYYNLEVNCIGTIHLAYGPSRTQREFISPDKISTIGCFSTLGNQPFPERKGECAWRIILNIPLSAFTFDTITTLQGVKAKANFYKIGDNLSTPHYLTWKPIATATPDYHRPEYFHPIWFKP